jgi:hypothetical protein
MISVLMRLWRITRRWSMWGTHFSVGGVCGGGGGSCAGQKQSGLDPAKGVSDSGAVIANDLG